MILQQEPTLPPPEPTLPPPIPTPPPPEPTLPPPIPTPPPPEPTLPPPIPTPPPPEPTLPPPIPTPPPPEPPVPDCPVCPPGICKPDKRCPTDPCLQCDPVLLPHPEYCEMFLKCTHGFACEMKCPAGLHWSTALNRCDWPFMGDCADGPIPELPPPGGDCPLDNRCPAFDNPWNPTMLPHPSDCTKFIKCDNKRGCVKSCPDGLHWSVAHNRCEWPNIAGCDPNIPPSDPDCPICPCTPCRMRQERHPCVDNDICKRNLHTSISLPYSADYSRFYECLSGKACLLDCPKGTRFNAMRQGCEDI